MMDTQFAKFLQIGIIVENVEETVKQYEKYGIGPWRISPLDSAEFPDFTMNGKKERLQTVMAFCDCWGFELELIQPVSDSPYKTWLEEHAYLDLHKELGLFLEIYNEDKKGGLDANFKLPE